MSPASFRKTARIVTLTAFFALAFIPSVSAAGTAAENRARGMALLDKGDYRAAGPFFARAWQLEPRNADLARWHMRLSMRLGQLDLIDNDHAAARAHFAAGLRARESINQNHDEDWANLKRMAELTDEHEKYHTVKPDYVYRFQILFLKNSDISNSCDWAGRPVSAKGSLDTGALAELEHFDRLTRVHLEAWSRGRLSLAANYRVVDTTLTRVLISARSGDSSIFNPDLDSCRPSLAPLLFAGRNTFDTTVFYWYGGDIPNWAYTYWGKGTMLYPYVWYSPATRPQINYKSGAQATPHAERLGNFIGHWVHIHEFFHLIEQLCGNIGPEHPHMPYAFAEARRRFPDWVPDSGSGWDSPERSWFRYHFRTTIPQRMEELAKQRNLYPAFRNMSFVNTRPDRTDEEAYKTCTRALDKISFANLRKASELEDTGYGLARAGNTAGAARAYEQALVHNPYHRPALEWLGWHAIASMNNDFARADRFYSRLAAFFPDPRSLANIAWIFFERNQPAYAARYYRILADRPGANPVYAAWLARALGAALDAPGAAAARARLGKHPYLESPIAVLDSSYPYVGLRSVSNPEDEGVLRLWGYPHDPSRIWRLVPAGSGGEVRIVSEYNWKCLEDRGSSVALVPPCKTAAQLWLIRKDADGTSRIRAKISGRLLTVIPGANNNDHTLALQPANNAPGQRWNIELRDPLTLQAEALPPVMLLTAHDAMALDLDGGNAAEGTKIHLWERHTGPNQKWKLVPFGANGDVLVVSAMTGKCLGLTKNGEGFRAVQQAMTRAPEQLWCIVPKDKHTFRLVNRKTGLALQQDPWDKHGLLSGAVEDTARQLWKREPANAR